MEHFFPRIQVETCTQMHTGVKLLVGMQMKTILKLLGGYSQIIGGDISPHPPRISAPLAVILVHAIRSLKMNKILDFFALQ